MLKGAFYYVLFYSIEMTSTLNRCHLQCYQNKKAAENNFSSLN
jgi:hypothetical protein